MPAAGGARRSPVAPAVIYTGLTVVLVLLVATLSFTGRQPPPPQIAELTPQAQHQITKAPTQLGSSVGSAKGGACTGGGPCASGGTGPGTTTTTTTLPGSSGGSVPPVDLAAVHHCFGDPPRQIEDTQSPPCIAYWAGNNGGATSRGVSGTTITVTVDPIGGYGPADENASRVVKDLQSFFNTYFEFYGRVLDLQQVNDSGGVPCSEGTSEADGIAQSYQPFASTAINNTAEVCVSTELARDHIVAASFDDNMGQATMRSFAPYLWEYPVSEDEEMANTGAFVCAQLAGHDAVYSQDPSIASQPRKFGLILEYMQTPYPYSTEPLTSQLARCGVKLAAQDTWNNPENGANQESEGAQFSRQAVLDMQSHGVTTVLCFCRHDDAMEEGIAPAAASQNYHPEWVLMADNSTNAAASGYWAQHGETSLIGLSAYPAQVPYSEATLNWALEAVDPGFEIDYANQEYNGYQELYWELLLIASGIQMAGPDLTPATFQRGLSLADFPNPYSPEQEGVASFLGGSHSMVQDEALMWWSSTAPSPYSDQTVGSWCYVDAGRRFDASDWPSSPLPLFQGACDSVLTGS